MANQLQLSGAQSVKPIYRAPIFTNRFFQGLWTQRNPLRDAGSTRIEERFYGARGDAMIGGSNVEISNRLTPVKRPGSGVYNSSSFTDVLSFYEFRQFSPTTETITVMVDTSTNLYNGTGPSTKTSIWTKSSGAGQSYMQSVGNTLYFGNGVDQKQWMQPNGWVANTSLTTTQYAIGTTVIDTNGNLEYLTSVTVGNVVNAEVAANVAILTFNNTSFGVTPGMMFQVDLSTATFLNSYLLIATSVTPSGSDFIVQAAIPHAPYASASDTGTAVTTDVGTPAITQATHPAWNVTVGGATTETTGISWTNYGNPVYNWGPPDAPTTAPSLSQGIFSIHLLVFWQALTELGNAHVAVDPNVTPWRLFGNNQSGGTYPKFVDPTVLVTGSTVSGSTTTLTFSLTAPTVQDGGTTWYPGVWLGASSTYLPSGPTSWQANTPVTAQSSTPTTSTLDTYCVDSNGNLQFCSVAGTTGGTAPAWNTTYGSSTNDNGVNWVNYGPWLGLAFQGWQYGYAYHCVDGSVSTLSPLTSSTTAVIDGVVVEGVGSSASDCDSIWIFRTTDGGATPLFLAQIPNPGGGQTWTFNDFYNDSCLDLFMEGPQADSNNPPPVGLINITYHLGRIFGSVDNTVYWSDGPDTLVGNGSTAFPPDNSAVLPSKVTRIIATSIGAVVFTVSDIYLIIGQGTSSSPLFATPYVNNIGLLSYNALSVNGTTVYLFTSDSQVISLDPSSGVSQIGFPIGDQFQLSNWSASTAYVTWHVSGSEDHALYVGDGASGWFRMNPTPAPEAGLTWNPFATIVGGAGAIRSVETSPGVHQLLIGPATTGAILARNLNLWTDNGTAYTANFTIGSIVLAQPGQVAELDFLATDAPATGTAPTPAILIDEVSGTFEALPLYTADPPQLPKSVSTYNQRFYFSQTQSPAICRHCQVNIAWPAENFQNELYSMTIFGGFMQEN
jgi:hypothetical protein